MRGTRSLSFAALLSLIPAIGRSNEAVAPVAAMLPSIWVALPGVSTFISMLVILGIVLLIESVVLVFGFRQKWLAALWISFIANLATTLLGMMLVCSKGIGLIIFLASLLCAYWSISKRFKWRQSLLWIFLFLFAVITVFAVFIDQPTVPRMVVQFYAVMFYSFAMTLFFEAAIFTKKAGDQAWRWSLTANGASYLLLFTALLASGFRSGSLISLEGPRYDIARRSSYNPDRQEVIRHFEELYLWERSSKRGLVVDGLEWPLPELQLVRNWAAHGHRDDARQLYSVIAAYRPRHITGPNTETYDYFWLEAENALSPANQPKR